MLAHEVPKDRGWAWFTVLGAFVNQMFVVGGARSFGVIFVHLTEHFNATSTSAAGAFSLMLMGLTLYSPLAAMLGKRYTFRAVTMVGAAAQGFAFFLAAFATNIYFASFSIGIIDGLAVGLLYTNSYSVVGQYFVNKRSIGLGLVTLGTPVGQLAIPILVQYLLDTYGYRGCLLIYGALAWNSLPACALFRPTEFDERSKHPKKGGKLHVSEELAKHLPLKTQEVNSDEKVVTDSSSLTLNDGSVEDVLPSNISEKSSTQGSPVSTLDKSSVDESTTSKNSTTQDYNPRPSTNTKPFRTFCSQLGHQLKSMFDPAVMKRPTFILYTISLCMSNTALFYLVAFLPSYCKTLGISKQHAAMILAASGLGDLGGKAFSAIFNNFRLIGTHHLISLGLGLVTVVTAVCLSYPSLATVLAIGLVVGVSGGVYLALYPVYLLELMGAELFPSAFALSMAITGVNNFIMPLVAGAMIDHTGSVVPFLWLCVVMNTVGIVMFQLEPVAVKREQRRQREQPRETARSREQPRETARSQTAEMT